MYFSHIEIQNLKPYGVSYDAVTRSKNHKWDLQNYIVLLILENFYMNSWADRTKVFNKYFEKQIGVSIGLSEGALRTMHRQVKGKFDYPIGEWQALKVSLEHTAQSIGLELQIKPPNHGLGHTTFSAARNEDPTLGRALFQPFEEPNHGIPTPPESPRIRHKKSFKFPRLGFRAFHEGNQGVNSNTRFRAGRFNNQKIAKPPHVSSRLYRHNATRHVDRIHIKTPFISVTKNLVRALQLGFQNEADSHIAVIDLYRAGKVVTNKEGENPYIQAVSRLKLNLAGRYRGVGEYLIWGGIDSDAIINVITLSKLVTDCPTLPSDLDPFGLQILRSSSDTRQARSRMSKKRLALNFVTGQCVGRLVQLLKIPYHLRESMVLRIVKDWKFIKYQSWRRNSDFLTGVNSEVEAVVSQEKSMDWDASFVVELKRAASGSGDTTKPESRAAVASSAWAQELATAEEEFRGDESKTNSIWFENFVIELRESAELDDSYEDRQYDSCSTIGKSQVDYPDSDEED